MFGSSLLCLEERHHNSDVDERKHGWMVTKYGHMYYGYNLQRLSPLPVETQALARPPSILHNKSFELITFRSEGFQNWIFYRFKYIIIFYDDYTSMSWIKLLCTKDQALIATKEFIKDVQNQHSTSIKGWMLDAGKEYKLKPFEQLMQNHGIHIYESAPHTPQQNKYAEWFIHILMDKA